jgi:molybdopterin synthase catalytic subunit
MSVKVRISEGPLAGPAEAWQVPGAGAHILFDGIVRGLEEGRPISGLQYSAYRPMADEQLQRLAEEVAWRNELIEISVEHSVGFVPVGQCSFRLRVAAVHRKPALRAVDDFIDALKRDVPIWKEALDLGVRTPSKAEDSV